MTTITKKDAINAAMGIADDVAQGRLTPDTMQAQLIAEMSQLVGVVVGPDDALFDLQTKIARGVLAAGGIGHEELSEWAAVGRRRAGVEPSSGPLPLVSDISATEPVSSVSDADGPDSGGVESEPGDADPEPTPEADPVPPGMTRIADGTLIPTHRIAGRGRDLPFV
jgi:hypothetical protein